MLAALGSPYAKAGNEADKLEQLLTLLRSCKVRLILLDECNHLADRGAQKTHHSMADGIKELLGRGQRPIWRTWCDGMVSFDRGGTTSIRFVARFPW